MERLFFLPLIVMTLFMAGVPAALLFHVSPAEIFQAISSGETLFALRLSLTTSLLAVSASILLGVPAAYLLARRNFFGKATVDALLDLPLVMTPLIAGVGLLFLFGQNWLGGALADLGLRLLFTPWGAVAAQTFIAAPILTRSSRTGRADFGPVPVPGLFHGHPASRPAGSSLRDHSGLGAGTGGIRGHAHGRRGDPVQDGHPAHIRVPEHQHW
jgi:ABC-type sulfate transport system permease component